MNKPNKNGSLLFLCAVLILFGCASGEKTAEKKEPPIIPSSQKTPEQTTAPEQKTSSKVDTVTVDVQNQPKPVYEPKPAQEMITAPIPSGTYGVQVGAYSKPDNAERIAQLVKERFGMKVHTIQDKTDNMYKVMIGDFLTKDEARRFRDDIAKKFPDEYKDAWVSEIPQE